MIRSFPIRAAALACVVAPFFFGGCSGRRLVEGNTPFPAKTALMVDERGTARADLPPSPEPLKLVVLDFPWCPPCGDAWGAIAAASKGMPPGGVRVYRILFDREKLDTVRGPRETTPLHPSPPPPAMAFPVTTLTALPAAFRERFEIDQVPVVLLADASGRILKRWVGYTPGLQASLREELSLRAK